jgi:hypothetical protein
MGFFSDLFGGGSKDYERGAASARSNLNTYFDKGRGQIKASTDRSVRFLQPQLDAGTRALGTYETATGLRGKTGQKAYFDNFQSDPGFQATQDAGEHAVTTNAASKGFLLSGRSLKELHNFGQTHMEGAFKDRLDRLERLSGRGQEAANSAATLTFQGGKEMADSYYGQGGALANIDMTEADAKAKSRFTLGDLGKMVAGGISAYYGMPRV